MQRIHAAILFATSSMLIAGAAQAQEAEAIGLEEVVVTAQRRTENLQDVPIAVSAITAATAQRLGINDPVSVAQVVPGFQMSRQAHAATPFIRGVGTTGGFVGNEPSVSMYVDDVYVPSGTASLFDFNNIDSVEVLKGPQGTLFGRNATGGVVHIRTKNPTRTPTMDLSAGYANYDTRSAQFYGSAGLTDTVSANLALYAINQKDGWGRNVLTGREEFTAVSQGGRAKVLIEPDADTSFLFSGVYDVRKSNQGLALRQVPGAFGRNGESPDRLGAGFYDGVANFDGGYRTKFQQYSLKAKKDFENLSIVSVSAYSKLHSRSDIDIDSSSVAFINAPTIYGGKTFTQELQFVSAPDAPFKWIIGAFYLNDKSFFDARFNGTAFGPLTNNVLTYQLTDSVSGFAQASAEIMPRTNLTIGLRYTTDKRTFQGGQSLGSTQIGPFRDSKSFNSLTGRFALDYKVSDDAMVYVAFNRGFKSGVYNLPGLLFTSTAAPAPVLPEDLNAYSAGFKSEWMDRRVRLNAEAYYYDYKNIQVQNNVPGGTTLLNGGAARIKGFDADLTVLPIQGLTLTAAVSVADGEYTKFPAGPQFLPAGANAAIPLPAGCNPASVPVAGQGAPAVTLNCNLKGNKTVQTIPLALNLSATYRVPTSVGPFDLAVSYAHGGDFYWEAGNDPDSYQKKTDVVNASVTWSTTSENFSVRLWGKNLGQEKYYAYAANSATSYVKYSPAPPRTYGVTLSAHY